MAKGVVSGGGSRCNGQGQRTLQPQTRHCSKAPRPPTGPERPGLLSGMRLQRFELFSAKARMIEEQVHAANAALTKVRNDAVPCVKLKQTYGAKGRAGVPPDSSGTAVRLELMHSKRLSSSEHLTALTARIQLDKLTLGRRGSPPLRPPRRLRPGGRKESPSMCQRFSAKRRPPQGKRLLTESLVTPVKARKPDKVLFKSSQP